MSSSCFIDVDEDYLDSLVGIISKYHSEKSLLYLKSSILNSDSSAYYNKVLNSLDELIFLSDIKFYIDNFEVASQECSMAHKSKEVAMRICNFNEKNVSEFRPVRIPSNFIITSTSNDEVSLSWEYQETPTTTYILERSLDNVNFISLSNSSIKSYLDSSLSGNTLYYYRVKAVEGVVQSEYKYLSVRTLLNPATNFNSNEVTFENVHLIWDDTNTGETGYEIDISLDNTIWVNLTTTIPNKTDENILNLDEGVLYYFRIRALNTLFNNNSAYAYYNSNTYLITPTNLVLSNILGNSIDLTWIDNSLKETKYIVEISLDGVSWGVDINNLPPNSINHTSTGLIDGTNYYYRVTAEGGSFTSLPSNIKSAVTAVNPPTNLTITSFNLTEAVLVWEDNSGVELGYSIMRKVTSPSGTFVEIGTVAPNIITYTDNTL